MFCITRFLLKLSSLCPIKERMRISNSIHKTTSHVVPLLRSEYIFLLCVLTATKPIYFSPAVRRMLPYILRRNKRERK